MTKNKKYDDYKSFKEYLNSYLEDETGISITDKDTYKDFQNRTEQSIEEQRSHDNDKDEKVTATINRSSCSLCDEETFNNEEEHQKFLKEEIKRQEEEINAMFEENDEDNFKQEENFQKEYEQNEYEDDFSLNTASNFNHETDNGNRVYEDDNYNVGLSNTLNIICLLLTGLCIYFKGFPGYQTIALLAASFCISVYVQIVIHESGHYIFGKLSGYSFVSFRIGKKIFIKDENGKLTTKKFSIYGTGGQCLMMPPDMKNGKYPHVLYNLGGCILNLIVAFVCLYFYFNIKYIPFISELLIVNFGYGLLSALLNGLPRKVNGLANDGFNAFLLKNDINVQRAVYIQLKVNAALAKGLRLKDLDRSVFDIDLNCDIRNPLISAVYVQKCAYIADSGDFKEAKEESEFLLNNAHGMLSVHRSELKCEVLFYNIIEGAHKIDIDNLITVELQRYINTTSRYYISRRRLLYAYELLVNENEYNAKKQLELFNNMVPSYPYLGEIKSEQELIKYIDKIYEKRKETITQ